jgi:predicted RND superfamily exporter protein
LAWAFIERDGTRGRLVFATLNPERFNLWNVRHLRDASNRVRKLDTPATAIVGGQPFVFADMLRSMERDGPLSSIVAFLGAFLAIFMLMGRTRYALVTIACMAIGTLGMIALAAVASIKANFLDFVAVPITIGIGVDYAVNMAARARQGSYTPRYLLATTGGAVFLCSLTTIIGYGSLLLSDNAGIRSFGTAAILGEVACIVAALVLVPLLLCRAPTSEAA